MADRLAELLRQRALLQEHLAWLDAEIAAASRREFPRAPESPFPAAPVTVAAQILARAAPSQQPPANPQSAFGSKAGAAAIADAAPTAADEILDQYRSSPDSLKTDVRKGCLLYFLAAFAVLGLVVLALWMTFQRHRQDDNQPPAQIRVERRP